MITIVDYGLGNINAIATVYKFLNTHVQIVSNAAELKDADKIILPGVGAFDYAMDKLNQSGMRETLDDLVMTRHRDVLGICVGLQMMSHSSEEGQRSGLGWLNASVRKFDDKVNGQKQSIPHMGWNNISPSSEHRILNGLDENSYFYFLHSYYWDTPEEETVLAKTRYGRDFVCVVNHENIFGVQFHPEKSHESGIRLLKNFAEI